MDIILRSVRIIHPCASYHLQLRDIAIENGVVTSIASKLANKQELPELAIPNLHVSLGWVDMNASFADPGHEQKETIETGCRAAAAGGYTHVCIMPNTNPPIDTKAQVEYLINKSKENIVTLLPIGAASHHTECQDLADIYDMYQAGAVAYSDGVKPSASAGMVERELLYIKAFDGLLMTHPEDKSISKNGVMNEGELSTRLGLPAMPALAEELMVARDIYLQEYTQSRLHLLDISTQQSMAMIRAAKKKTKQLSASVNAHHLLLDESTVGSYNTLAKLNPPLRTTSDIKALIKGIKEGIIDTITSQHQPQEEDCKNLEFDKAEYGMIGLETCYAVANTALHTTIDTTQLVGLMSGNARRILKLPTEGLGEGESADMTLFIPDKKWKFTLDEIGSKSKNTPLIGCELIGQAIGIIHKNQIKLHHEYL